MAVGAVTKYTHLWDVLLGEANRQWDDATTGNIMFGLVTNGYTPSAAHTTAGDLSTNIITTGDGVPVNAASTAVNVSAGYTWITSGDAVFGDPVSITAKYLVCMQPVVAGTYASTAKLLWYVDLDDTSGSTSITSTASEFTVHTPTNGWIRLG
jgi:hypothetical protein